MTPEVSGATELPEEQAASVSAAIPMIAPAIDLMIAMLFVISSFF
jgi:hypothetical protein